MLCIVPSVADVHIMFMQIQCMTAGLMDPALQNVKQARRLIADLETPALPGQGVAALPTVLGSALNGDQQAAVQR